VLVSRETVCSWADPEKAPLIGAVGQGRRGQLPLVAGALHPPRRLPRVLEHRKQQRDEEGDNRDYHEQFNEAEPAKRASVVRPKPAQGMVGETNPIEIHEPTLS
jgi:hypothetical protein